MLCKYTTINGDDDCVFMFVECMMECRRVGRGRTGGTFVLVYALQFAIWICCSCSMQYEVVISLYVMSKYTTMSMTTLHLCSLNLWDGVWTGRTVGTFVLIIIIMTFLFKK